MVMWQAARPGRHLFVACSVAKCPYSGEKNNWARGLPYMTSAVDGGRGGPPEADKRNKSS